ncbi:hypothetical protein [Devosia sp.]|uniref:hypothetical protein n=1 Tax=Devosia sp. TaxID=1871048 RepID=UPI003A8F6E08
MAVAAVAAVVLALGYLREIAIWGLGWPAHSVGDRMFSLDSERNLPAWFTALLLLGIGVLMLRVARSELRQKLRTAWGWVALGIGFVYLALDERFMLHEP